MPLNKYPRAPLQHSGFLRVTGNSSIYYEQRGNPSGPAVVFIHGGPGGLSCPEDSQWFDPDYYNIILYDQRGTGQSRPSISNMDTEPQQFSTLTIDDMTADLDKLRISLEIDKWLLFGGSWGSTLSLYYAANYPKHVAGLIIYGIFLNTPEEMSQYFDSRIIKERFSVLGEQALQVLFAYAKSRGYSISPDKPQQFVDTYYKLCIGNDMTAQYLWTAFERFNDEPTDESLRRLRDVPEIINPSDRTHAVFETTLFRYAYHGFNLLDERLLTRLKDIDIRILQGRNDTEAPPIFAQQLIDALRKIKPDLWYHFIDGKHAADSSVALTDALLDCTNAFKHVPPPKIKQAHARVSTMGQFSKSVKQEQILQSGPTPGLN
ncbi:MAG: alpha/beta fold hydrolase [Legionella sp.]|uniref:alpha/beta fold hydrolase n=1 Tax=Legionella sp. TaxID=459 RepID=UPI0039E313FC